jgi:hypothetical protein
VLHGHGPEQVQADPVRVGALEVLTQPQYSAAVEVASYGKLVEVVVKVIVGVDKIVVAGVDKVVVVEVVVGVDEVVVAVKVIVVVNKVVVRALQQKLL